MFGDILKHYLQAEEFSEDTILLDEVAMSPDYSIYLVKNGNALYSIARADYLFMNELVHDIEKEFPVHVEGWLRERSHQKDGGLVRPNLFKSPSVSEGSDEEWETYHQITTRDDEGENCVVLKVGLNPDVTIEDILG